jgi:hypothetical protein
VCAPRPLDYTHIFHSPPHQGSSPEASKPTPSAAANSVILIAQRPPMVGLLELTSLAAYAPGNILRTSSAPQLLTPSAPIQQACLNGQMRLLSSEPCVCPVMLLRANVTLAAIRRLDRFHMKGARRRSQFIGCFDKDCQSKSPFLPWPHGSAKIPQRPGKDVRPGLFRGC